MNLDSIVLVKPKAYENMGKSATEELLKADQRVLSTISILIEKGEEQLKAKTGYTNEKLPDASPKSTDFTLDGIKFSLLTYVRVNNPEYQPVFDKTLGFLEVLVNDWKQGIKKDIIRTYDVGDGKKIHQKAPFGEWNYLMRNILWYVSRETQLGAVNEIEGIVAPAEIDEMKLEKLVVPVALAQDFDINKPGAAKIWYLAGRFYDKVNAEIVTPPKEEMVARTGVTVEELPKETSAYLEQFEKLLYRVQSIPSPRRQPGKALDRLFAIPQKTKGKESTALPVVPGPQNYLKLLEEYRPILPTSLKKWKNLDGNIGELVVFYYGIKNDPKVQEQFPFLPEYHLKRYDGKMFVSVQAIHDRMKALENDYVKNRLLRRHSIVPIV